jgi:CheY-like chemotaxis protein
MASVPRRILLVEDDASIREMFSCVLRDAGMDVVEAADGLSALEAMADLPLDLVITDIAMPRMDGVELTRTLRRRSSTQLIPIIAVTGEPAIFGRARAAGCTAIVSKPYAAADLLALVKQFIGRRHEDRRVSEFPWTGADRRGYARPS